MSVMNRNAAVLLLALLVTAAGLFEVVAGRSWDLVVVFALIAVLQLVVLGGLWVHRRPVGLRGDLAAWIDEHAVATGESAERIVDRAVSSYRAGLSVPGTGSGERP